MRVVITFHILFFLFLLSCNDPVDTDVSLPELTVEDIEVNEGENERNIFVSLRLEPESSDMLRVELSTEDGTAREGEDYEAFGGTIDIEEGRSLYSVGIRILGDDVFEENETFFLNVIFADGARLAKSSARITILNDDNRNSEVVIPENGYTTPTEYPGMEMVWNDEFNEIDKDYWTFEIGRGNNGWGNQELQYYTDDNAFIKDGHLVIEARNEVFGGSNYTSSRMITKDKFEFKYGRVDIRGVLPYGQGIWPAFWMLGANISEVGWPRCGEIDIMEMIGGQGRENEVHGTVHWDEGGHAYTGKSIKLPQGIFNDEFHVFSIVWDENSITWMMDDQPYNTFDLSAPARNEFLNEFFVIFNLAVGGLWPGYPDQSTQFPQHLIVDYIRVFQTN